MRKIIAILLLLIYTVLLVSCKPDGSVGGQQGNGSDGTKKDFLVEHEEYIDLTSTYDGVSFDYDSSLWYMNDLKDVPLPDPFVFVEGDKYYIVGTNERNVKTVDCYVTTDFKTYELYTDIYNPSLYKGWEGVNPEIYAPEIYCFDGVYYMYYSADDKGGVRRCSVVTADNPIGPYKPLVNSEVDGLNNPLFYTEEYPSRCLDTTLFTDDDGKMYMYFVTRTDVQYIVGVELITPYLADWSTYKELVKPGTLDSESDELLLEWELYRNGKLKIAEAPFMIKNGGKYYMTYSVNGCWNKYYNVCYAVSDDPMGNFVKPYEEGKIWTNLLLGYPGTNDASSDIFNQWTGFASGTGHHCFFYVGDELMIGYHGHQNRNWDSTAYTPRYFAIDYVYFDEGGVPFCNGPSYSIVNLPSDISGAKNIVPNAVVTSVNVQNLSAVKDNYIVDCYNLDSNDREVSLGKGESYIELSFDRSYEIEGLIVYNSAYYDEYIIEIEYIDFGNGNIIYYPQFCEDFYVNTETKFIYPQSCFNIEFIKSFSADSVRIGFNLPEGGSINEIVILGK